jgi:CRP-like cAMP-binding protein
LVYTVAAVVAESTNHPQISVEFHEPGCDFPHKIPLLSSLQGFDDQCLGFVASHLLPAAFAKDEVIFECGDRGDEMYFIVDGDVLIHTGPLITLTSSESNMGQPTLNQQAGDGWKDGRDTGEASCARKSGRIVGKGDVFGEGGLFTKELGLLRRESAKTQSWVSVYVLTAVALREISLEYPEVSWGLFFISLTLLFLPLESCLAVRYQNS